MTTDKIKELKARLLAAQNAVLAVRPNQGRSISKTNWEHRWWFTLAEACGIILDANGNTSTPAAPKSQAPPLLTLEPRPERNASNIKLTPLAESLLRGKEMSEKLSRKPL